MPELTLKQLDSISRAQSGPHAAVYARAIELRDWNTAIFALHYLLLEDPQNRILQDSLAHLYFKTGNFHAAIKLGKEIIDQDAKDGFIHHLLAVSYNETGDLKSSVRHYEWLFDGMGNPYFGYMTAVQNFHLGREKECRELIRELTGIGDPNAAWVAINSAGTNQEVPVQAAAWNLLGNLEVQNDNKDAALEAFNKAIEFYPEFPLAKFNRDALQPPRRKKKK